jgi:U3 small nucleolar RNA-associated protein 3
VDRNPRVKKRKKQYEKAKKNRKGAVREMRTKEIGKYQGETTGIRTTITRSRRLG